MNAIVFEHVPVDELPEKWRSRLTHAGSTTVTVRIEEEARKSEPGQTEEFGQDSLFGMWRDREDMADVADYVRTVRAPRFSDDGTPRSGS